MFSLITSFLKDGFRNVKRGWRTSIAGIVLLLVSAAFGFLGYPVDVFVPLGLSGFTLLFGPDNYNPPGVTSVVFFLSLGLLNFYSCRAPAPVLITKTVTVRDTTFLTKYVRLDTTWRLQPTEKFSFQKDKLSISGLFIPPSANTPSDSSGGYGRIALTGECAPDTVRLPIYFSSNWTAFSPTATSDHSPPKSWGLYVGLAFAALLFLFLAYLAIRAVIRHAFTL